MYTPCILTLLIQNYTIFSRIAGAKSAL